MFRSLLMRLARTPEPPYYAVIFSSERTEAKAGRFISIAIM